MLIYVGKTNDVLCPVSATLAYLSIRGTKEGPLFSLQRWQDTYEGEIRPNRALTAAGTDATKYSGTVLE